MARTNEATRDELRCPRQDDPELQRCRDREREPARPSPEEQQPHHEQLDDQRRRRAEGVERMRPLLHVPAEPRRQRSVLVVLVHRREVAPLRLAAEDFHQARLEVDAEPFVLQEEDARARRRMRRAEAGTQTGRGEEEREEAGLEEHAVRLIRGEVLRRGHERQEADDRDADRDPRREVQRQHHRGDEAGDHDRAEHRVAGVDPEQRRREPERAQAERGARHRQPFTGRKDAGRSDQSVNLKPEGVERGEEDRTEGAEEEPARAEIGGLRCEPARERRLGLLVD